MLAARHSRHRRRRIAAHPRPAALGRHHSTLLDVFRLSLQTDQQMLVRIAALKALASFLLAVESKAERNPFQELVPGMLQTIADALAASEEQECRDALEVRSRSAMHDPPHPARP